jgi:hypothetical protein
MKKSNKKKPTWTDLKRQLADLDHPALLVLIQGLYAASKNNQAFLHARFALGEDVLEPFKATIDRWVCPDVMRNQDISVSKAKKAIVALEPDQQASFVERLERVRREGNNWGWGVGDDMDDLIAEYGFAEE